MAFGLLLRFHCYGWRRHIHGVRSHASLHDASTVAGRAGAAFGIEGKVHSFHLGTPFVRAQDLESQLVRRPSCRRIWTLCGVAEEWALPRSCGRVLGSVGSVSSASYE